ncbi:MAG: hypothetical protein RIR00_1361 [Pseudomonadota bacterium]
MSLHIERRRWMALALGLPVLAACETLNVQTAARGTELEAAQVVALIYDQLDPSGIDEFRYAGGDLSRAVLRMHQRFPQLRPWLDRGGLAISESGFLVRRGTEMQNPALVELVRSENFDRALLYTQASIAVGHGTDNLNSWLPYASWTFGREWIRQGRPGWWVLDEQGGWRQIEPD